MCVGRSKMPNHWRWYHFAFLYREERASLSRLLPSSQMTETSSLLTFCHLKDTKSDPPDGKLLQTSTCSLSLEVLSEVAVFGQPSLQLSHLQCGNAPCVLVHMQVQSVPFYFFAIFDSADGVPLALAE